jgi:hypothetical protein
VHTKDGGRGLILGEYPIVVEGEAVLRAGVRSEFLLDDVCADVYNKDGSIALVGRHSLSHNRVEGVLRRGEYILKIRGPLSASKLLLASAAGDWEQLHDEQGQAYYHSKSLGKTSWDPPAADAGTWCVRYAIYASLEPASASGGCPDGALNLPTTLNVPGLLGHEGGAMGATLRGLFRADGDVFNAGLGSSGGGFKDSTGPVRYMSMRLERKSILRLALWSVSGGLASATLLQSRHNGSAETVAGSTPWSQGDYSSSGGGWPEGGGDERRQLLDVMVEAVRTPILVLLFAIVPPDFFHSLHPHSQSFPRGNTSVQCLGFRQLSQAACVGRAFYPLPFALRSSPDAPLGSLSPRFPLDPVMTSSLSHLTLLLSLSHTHTHTHLPSLFHIQTSGRLQARTLNPKS